MANDLEAKFKNDTLPLLKTLVNSQMNQSGDRNQDSVNQLLIRCSEAGGLLTTNRSLFFINFMLKSHKQIKMFVFPRDDEIA